MFQNWGSVTKKVVFRRQPCPKGLTLQPLLALCVCNLLRQRMILIELTHGRRKDPNWLGDAAERHQLDREKRMLSSFSFSLLTEMDSVIQNGWDQLRRLCFSVP